MTAPGFVQHKRTEKAVRLEYALHCAGHSVHSARALSTAQRREVEMAVGVGKSSDDTWELALQLMESSTTPVEAVAQ